LPAYDEFLISYRDRSASLSIAHTKKTVSSNGIFRPFIVIDGQVVGLWKRNTAKNKVIIEIDSFYGYKTALQSNIRERIDKYERFLNREIEVRFRTEQDFNC
jgi:hypothetical protein